MYFCRVRYYRFRLSCHHTQGSHMCILRAALHIGKEETTAIGGQKAGHMWIVPLDIIDQDSRSSQVSSKHIVMNRNKQRYACCGGEIGGLAFIHVPDDIVLLAKVISPIDG